MEIDETGESLDPERARDALQNIHRSAGRAHGEGWRWVRIYLAVWAVASIGLVLGLGAGDRRVALLSLTAWAVLSIGGGIWSKSRGLIPRGGGRRIGRAAGLWAVFYAITIAVGTGGHPQPIEFWIIAAALTAVPLLVAALAPVPKSSNVS